MLIRNKRFKKFLSMFFLLTLVYEIGFPVAAYALTAGPTAPDATSFEPVDTTDMVNLATGDFTYNTPLLEVPGPEGGYPLSLSYHAGIQTSEEASWVGLGWTLNPGAITRNVNGYADDWNAVLQDRRDYWSGGSVATFGVDVGVGLGGASISSGLTWTSHNGKGFSVSVDAPRVGVNWTSKSGNTSVGITADMATGDASVSASVSDIGEQKIKDERTGRMTSISGNNTLGISLSSNGGANAVSNSQSRSASVGSFYNSSAGKISSESGGWSFGFPLLAFNLGLKSSYFRYWSDQSVSVSTYGAMYMGDGLNKDYASTTFDAYYFPENTSNLLALPDLEFQAGGAMPDVDNYMVNAQGLNGAIRPYFYKANVAGLNRPNSIIGNTYINNPDEGGAPNEPARPLTYKIASSSLGSTNPIASFRFMNDVSNTYQQVLTDFVDGSLNAQYDPAPITGDGSAIKGYDAATNHLEGSKHIEYFTNADIVSTASDSKAKKKGFVGIPQESTVFTRSSNKTIGGFSITAANGVTYHFALPAYNKGEMSYTEKIKTAPDDPNRWTKERKKTSYAYTWYLTAITGPDFVDRDANGYANEADFGYWVNFQYGRWFDNYNWRNPAEGFTVDVDNEFQHFSHGVKEVYYLNSIKTRTHTAIFEKDGRNDAHGVDSSWGSTYFNSTPYPGKFASGAGRVLRLNRILLLNNADVAGINPAAGTGLNQVGYLADKVIDKYDLANTQIESKCMKIIEFNQDYSLCPNTPNSFNELTPATKLGKLTLRSIKTLGKGGVAMLPPADFEYETRGDDVMAMDGPLTSNSPYVATITTIAYPDLGNKRAFAVGDLVSVTAGDGKSYTGYVSSAIKNPDNKYAIIIKIVGIIPFPWTTTAYLRVTKNPTYDKEFYDKWGMFKCDADGGEIALSANAGRLTTSISAQHVDAWSLRRISTPLGADLLIDYESDSYSQSAISNRTSLVAQNFVMDATAKTITFKISNTTRQPLTTLFPISSKLDMRMEHCGLVSAGLLGTPFVLSARPLTSDFITYYSNTYPNYTLVRNRFSFPVGGSFEQSFTVKSINESASTITINCFDPYIFGSTTKSLSFPGSTRDVTLYGTPLAANVFFYEYMDHNRPLYGGGVRVKELKIKDQERTISTRYNYNIVNDNISSGVTSYEPNTIEPVVFAPSIILFRDYPAAVGRLKAEYRMELSPDYGKILALSRMLPAPGIFYEYVTTSSEVRNVTGTGATDNYQAPGKATYQFVVPTSDMVSYQLTKQYNSGSIGSRNYSIVDKTATIGSLRRKIEYDNLGNKLTEVINSTLYDDLDPVRIARYKKQGEITERFVQAKQYKDEIDMSRDVATMTARTEKPNLLTAQTIIDYKKNTKEYTDFLEYDYYSGALTKKVETDVYGNRFRTDIIPAYRKYAGMANRIHEVTPGVFGKHMLSQEAASYVYKVDANNANLALVSANAQTWSNTVPALQPNHGAAIIQNTPGTNNGNVWRKQAAYIWMPATIPAGTLPADGLTPLGNFTDFNWATPASSAADWKKNNETTLYDVYSHSLEETDVNNNYASVRMGYGDSRVLITGSLSKQKELAFSGAEDALVTGKFSGFVSQGNGTVQNSSIAPVVTPHTGYNSLKVGAGLLGFSYSIPITTTEANKQYIGSVWVKSNTAVAPVANIYYQVNTGAQVPVNVVATRKAGDWYLLSVITPATAAVNGNTITFGCKNAGTADAYFDDFRVRPLYASTSAYVYDNLTGAVTYILDNNNLFTRFEYDAMGRLIRTYRETFSNGAFKVGENEYNYGKTRVYNDLQSKNYTRACDPGYAGTVVTYKVEAGTYYANTLVEANNLALADIAANGQAHANANGQCTATGGIVYVTAYQPSIVLRSITFVPVGGGTAQSFNITGSSITLGISPGTYNVSLTADIGEVSNMAFTSDSGASGCFNVSPGTQTSTFGGVSIAIGSDISFMVSIGDCN